jgi:hypothetical protein
MCTIGTGAVANKNRVHTFDPVEEVAANRPQLVVDVLTIIHAWQAAGKPLPAGFRSIPSFEDYDLIRGPLLWLGQADPADSQKALFETDTRVEERHAFLTDLYFKSALARFAPAICCRMRSSRRNTDFADLTRLTSLNSSKCTRKRSFSI